MSSSKKRNVLSLQKEELVHLLQESDLGSVPFEKHRIEEKLVMSMDCYVDGGFSMKTAVERRTPILVFRRACDDVVSYKGNSLPTDKQHLLRHIKPMICHNLYATM